MTEPKKSYQFLESLAHHSARCAGSPWAYLGAVAFATLWLVSGPFMMFSDTWELTMRIASGIVTFVMVFIIQRSQHKDSQAMQIKLNEIIAALHGANNRMINIENLSEREINSIQKDYQHLATHIHKDEETSIHTISIEEVIKLEEQ